MVAYRHVQTGLAVDHAEVQPSHTTGDHRRATGHGLRPPMPKFSYAGLDDHLAAEK